MMTIGIAGLGLMGGSLAKAYQRNPKTTVYGMDANASITEFAKLSGVIDNELNRDTIGECECVFIALYPRAARDYLESMAPHIPPKTLVMDCCGTKREMCQIGFRLAREYGFEFVGGHPMAGNHHAGFRSSRADLFEKACMVVVPKTFDDIVLYDRIKKVLEPAGFGKVSVTTAEKHDELIAFTSQMAHVVSNAFIKSPTAGEHKGFSAGSYKDLTRVAWLNPDMWTALFLENKDNLLKELDIFLRELQKYRDAIVDGDEKELHRLLEEGSRRKEEVDGA
jgi:prephenate dehydrogenase